MSLLKVPIHDRASYPGQPTTKPSVEPSMQCPHTVEPVDLAYWMLCQMCNRFRGECAISAAGIQ